MTNLAGNNIITPNKGLIVPEQSLVLPEEKEIFVSDGEAYEKELDRIIDLESESDEEDDDCDLEDEISFEDLTPEQIKLLRLRYKQAGVLQQLVRGVTLLEGKKGRGKTLAAVAIAYNLREFFDIKTIVVGTSLDLTSKYGEFEFIDEKEFVSRLDTLTQVTKNTSDEVVSSAVERVLADMGINLLDSMMIFDEAYKLFDSRSPSDKLVKLFGYFIAQSRHYKSTVLLLCPFRDMIDKRVRRQFDYYGRCFTNNKTHQTTVRISGGMESWKFKINGPTYWDMYDTHSIPGFRAKHLQIGSF